MQRQIVFSVFTFCVFFSTCSCSNQVDYRSFQSFVHRSIEESQRRFPSGFDSQSHLLRPHMPYSDESQAIDCTHHFNEAESSRQEQSLVMKIFKKASDVFYTRPFTLRSFEAGGDVLFYSPIHFFNLCEKKQKSRHRWIFGGNCKKRNAASNVCSFQIEKIHLNEENEDFTTIQNRP